MPFDLRIIRLSEFLRMDAKGHLDEQATRAFLKDAIWICAKSQVGRILLDIRGASSSLPTGELSSLAILMTGLAKMAADVSSLPDNHKVAILTASKPQFTRALLVANGVEKDAWNVEVFESYEGALEWLADQSDAALGRG